MNVRAHIIGLAAFLAVAGWGGVTRADLVKPAEEELQAAGERFDFTRWNELLKKYVDKKGRVNYARLRASAEDMKKLEALYAQVGRQRLDALSGKDAKLAFLIDAYNVCVWKNVLMRPPFKDLGSKERQEDFFNATTFAVVGKELSLNRLEGEEIRERFQDPRVHMAVNCASGGCPQLPNEAFMPAKLQAQLEREARKFCNEERNVSYDAATKTVRLSRIFDWYAKDFSTGALAFVNKYRAPDRQIPADARIEFVEYDWSLNDPHLKR